MSAKLTPVSKHSGIYRRGSRYVVRYRDPTGRSRQQSAATLAQARDLRASLLADVARGEYRQLARITFAQYAPEFLAHYVGRTRRGIREETLLAYGRELGFHRDSNGDWVALDPPRGAVAYLGKLRLSEIEAYHLKQYAARVAARGVSQNTVRLALAPVKALLATAVEERLLRTNPAAGVRLTAGITTTSPDPDRPKALSADQLNELIAAANPPWRLLIQFLAHTGLRISEALALTWHDIDLDQHQLHVRRRLYKGKLAPPKSSHSRRTLPTSPQLEHALTTLRTSPGYNTNPNAPLFQNRTGQPLDRHHALQQVKKTATSIGLPWVGLHTLRHTCATLLFHQGANAKQVQLYLGHHSAAFTLATYVHLLPEDLPLPTFRDPTPPPAPPRRYLTLVQPPAQSHAALHAQTSVGAEQTRDQRLLRASSDEPGELVGVGDGDPVAPTAAQDRPGDRV
jgi:integrase